MHGAGWKDENVSGTRRTHSPALLIVNDTFTHEVHLVGAFVPVRHETPGTRLERPI